MIHAPAGILGRHGPSDIVAFGGEGARTRSDLLRDASSIAGSLPLATEGSQILLVIERDRYALAAAMLAAWSRGHAVAFPPNGRRAGVAFVLTRPEIAMLVHDTDAGGHHQVGPLMMGTPTPWSACAWPAGPAIVWSTLADDGDGVGAWSQTGAQIEAEIAALSDRFPEFAGAAVATSIAPFGPASVLLGVVLPLLTGGAFARGSDGASADVTIVPPGNTGAVTGTRWVVTRDACDARLPSGPTLWTTPATGSLASRRNLGPWQPLGGVEAEIVAHEEDGSGRLALRVPWMPSAGRAPGCRARIHDDGSLVVLGRGDDLEGLPSGCVGALERSLLDRIDVEDAAVVARRIDSETTVFVVVATRGADSGLREELVRELGPGISIAFKSVPALLREPEGEYPEWKLLRLFGRRVDGRPRSETLRWGPSERTVDDAVERARVEVEIPDDYRWFVGHFDGYPILAGVVQLHDLVLPAIRRLWPTVGVLRELQKLKFLGRIVPGDRVSLGLRYDPRTSVCDFTIDKSERPCAAGRLCFKETAP